MSDVQDALMIGVSGMRGTIGGTLDPATVSRMAAAFAVWMKKQVDGVPVCVLGRDSRPSGQFVRDIAAGTLSASGVQVIDLGIVTTPGVALMVKRLRAEENIAGGMIVTASHNPIQWNGLKTLTKDAVALPPAAAAELRELYDANASDFVRVEHVTAPKSDTTTHAAHVKAVTDYIDMLGVQSKRIKVVVDSVNGAGCVTVATMLGKMGCEVVHLNSTPDGQFPHEPEPTEANLTDLCTAVKKHRAAVGFAQDPDADRLAIVDENGTYIGEEYSLVLAAMHVMRKKPGSVAVTNMSTSRMIDDVAAKFDGKVIRTPVGEANVIDAMLANDARIGGEGNGGVIDPRIVPGRDSLVGIAYTLQLMADTGKTLSQLVADIPSYAIVKDKLPLAQKSDAEPLIDKLAAHFDNENINTEDGLRVDWPDGWVSVRPSNTEPILRIIAEAPTEEAAIARIAECRKVAGL
ncbi:MAG: phosphoglucosamine mutase [Planctomycetota bacterium]